MLSMIQGQLMKSIKTKDNSISVDISSFPAGIYVIEIQTEKGMAVKKLVRE